jgi:hypothetical protein
MIIAVSEVLASGAAEVISDLMGGDSDNEVAQDVQQPHQQQQQQQQNTRDRILNHAAALPVQNLTSTSNSLSAYYRSVMLSNSQSRRELEGILLDLDMSAISMDNMSRECDPSAQRPLLSDEKCYRYVQPLLQYLYKRDPAMKRNQFNFEERMDESGNITHVFVPKSRTSTLTKYCKKYATTVAAPVLGIVLTALWKGVGGSQQLELQ